MDQDILNINKILEQDQSVSKLDSGDSDVQNIDKILGSVSLETPKTETPKVDTEIKKTGDSWVDFKSIAQKMAKESNFPASVLIGQASLESARGTSNFAKNRNNYFGFMAYTENPGKARRYSTPEQSIKDYINLIKNTPRYSWAYQQYLKDKDPIKLITNIKKSGYATANDRAYITGVTGTPEFKELSAQGN